MRLKCTPLPQALESNPILSAFHKYQLFFKTGLMISGDLILSFSTMGAGI